MNIVEDNEMQEVIEKLDILPEGHKLLTVTNRFSGESVTLTPLAEAVYSWIQGCERFEMYDEVRLGLDWFMEYYPKEYMILLD